MPSLITQRDRRTAQNLPFCYLCGKDFAAGDAKNRDHVPPECIFLPEDREPLWLPTHIKCNSEQKLTDEKIGQLIALRYGKAPSNPEHRRLQIGVIPAANTAFVMNLEIDSAVWRWVKGFHSALYREPLVGEFLVDIQGALVTPFPRAAKGGDSIVAEPLRSQHLAFVRAIKLNRMKSNLDRIVANKGKLTYECIWCQTDNSGPWMCVFALNVYDWKDLGRTPHQPARGCAGMYMRPDGEAPASGSRAMTSPIAIPDTDPLDPFSS